MAHTPQRPSVPQHARSQHSERQQRDAYRRAPQRIAPVKRSTRVSQQVAAMPYGTRRIPWIAIVLLVAVVAVLIMVAVRSCAPDDGDPGDTLPVEPAYQSPYDWDNLVYDGDRLSYKVDGRQLSRQGIDVSENQHYIDWEAVAADGIDFALIRAGYRGSTAGDLYTDEYFEYNLQAAQAAGVDCGIYFFSQAISPEEAVEEAEYVLALLDGARLEYPIAYDSEETFSEDGTARTSGLSRSEMTAIAEAFCACIDQAGYEAIIYGNAHDVSRYDTSDVLDGYAVWWAEYEAAWPSPQLDIVLWQYHNDGQVAGIDTAVDMNLDLRPALAHTQG